jgi:hypothetical protein
VFAPPPPLPLSILKLIYNKMSKKEIEGQQRLLDFNGCLKLLEESPDYNQETDYQNNILNAYYQ